MIYSCSLGALVKKAFNSRAVQTNTKSIAQKLPLDPATSGMDVCVLGPQDFHGFTGKPLLNAISKRHPEIRIIYVCRSEKEAEPVSALDIDIFVQSRITPEELAAHVNDILSDTKIRERSVQIISKDSQETDTAVIKDLPPKAVQVQITQPIKAPEEVIAESGDVIPDIPEPPQQEVKPEKITSIEERIKTCIDYPNWDLFKKAMDKEQVMRELMDENTKYAGCVNLLEVLDREITNIYKDTTLSAEVKMAKMKEIGVDRAAYKAQCNSLIQEKLSSIMATIVAVMTAAVEKRIDNVKTGLDQVATFQSAFKQQDLIKKLSHERLELNVELCELMQNIIETYKVMDVTVTEFLDNMDAGLPSENTYIDEIYAPIKKLFIPQNAAKLTTKIMTDLQTNRISLSSIETQIKGLVSCIFKLCDADSELIDHQQQLINLLSAQRIEDVVVINTVMKSALRIFIGPENVGTTATALTWAGIVARRQNTLLFDLRPKSKLQEYGQDTIDMEEFMATRKEVPFLCVTGTLSENLEEVDELIREVTTRMNYYANVFVILSDYQIATLNRFAAEALSVTFVSDSTPRSIELTRVCIKDFAAENVARKVCLIGCPIDPIEMLNNLEADILTTKAVMIPYIQDIRVDALKHYKPYVSADVCTVYEEAFR